MCSYSVYCSEFFWWCQKNHILIFKNFFRNSKLTYSYPIEELDSGIEKMTPNQYLILWHTAIQYINLLLKHVSLKFPAFLDDSLSKQVAFSKVTLSIYFLMINFR